MSVDGFGIESRYDAPVLQRKPLKQEQKGNEAREILEDANASRLNDTLAVVIPDPKNAI